MWLLSAYGVNDQKVTNLKTKVLHCMTVHFQTKRLLLLPDDF